MVESRRDRTRRAVEKSTAAKYRHKRYKDKREPSTRRVPIGMPKRCWCGDVQGHDWPKKDKGGPHPR